MHSWVLHVHMSFDPGSSRSDIMHGGGEVPGLTLLLFWFRMVSLPSDHSA